MQSCIVSLLQKLGASLVAKLLVWNKASAKCISMNATFFNEIKMEKNYFESFLLFFFRFTIFCSCVNKGGLCRTSRRC